MNPLSSKSLFGGRERVVPVRSGLEVVYGEFRLREPRLFHFKTDGMSCQFAFVLSGTILNRLSFLDKEIVVPPGHAALWLVPEVYSVHECEANEDIRFVCVSIRRSLLAETVRDDLDRLSPRVRALLEGGESGVYHDISAMSDRMLTVAQQFFTCPYQGTSEKLFFEGKALELVSHFMARLLGPGGNAGTSEDVRGDERIERVKRILLDNMGQPPSLSTLAEMVGLSQASLTRGFRKVVNMSVFEFLRLQRLEKARSLLETTDMNVTEISYFVGFANPSHLTRFFRKRFQTTPGAYRRTHHLDK